MADNSSSNLDAILDQYDEKLLRAKEAQVVREVREAEFITQYKQLQSEIIRPAMEHISEVLESRGHKVVINENDDGLYSEGPSTSVSIEMKFYPSP